MGAFDRWSDGPDRDTPTEVATVGKSAKVVAFDALAMADTRRETYANTRQSAESGWERHRLFEAPRAELARFRMARADLPEVGPEEAARYIEEQRARRPWLEAAERASPESRRIMAAIDRGNGHAHIRHEGWVTEEANRRRVAYLEDPAQLCLGKRLRAIDGLKPDDKRHRCGPLATRITDPDAFATAFARGVDHLTVRAALSTPHDPDDRSDPVRVPIADLLGRDGHKFCTGWQLEHVAGSMYAAIKNRNAWRTALAQEHQPDVKEASVQPVPTFEGGTIISVLGHNQARDGYEIVSLHPQPRDDDFPARRADQLLIGDVHGRVLLDAASRRPVRDAYPDLDDVS
jgi:hypothetical protein